MKFDLSWRSRVALFSQALTRGQQRIHRAYPQNGEPLLIESIWRRCAPSWSRFHTGKAGTVVCAFRYLLAASRWDDGGAEHGTGTAVPAQGSRGHANRRWPAGVAIENARLFTEEQRGATSRVPEQHFKDGDLERRRRADDGGHRARDPEKLHYDHIGIGIMDYATKDIEIKAEAGTASQTLGGGSRSAAECWERWRARGERTGAERQPGTARRCAAESRAVLCLPSVMARNCWVCSTSRAARRMRSRRRMF